MRGWRTALVLLCLLAAGLPRTAHAERLVTALSGGIVSISSNFSGAKITVFGTVERDAQTVSRGSPYYIVVTVTGPEEDVVVRRKERVAGIWVNRASEEISTVPSFYTVLTTRPLDEISTPELLTRFGLGFDYLPLDPDAEGAPPRRTDFEMSFLRLMETQLLYAEEIGAVSFLSPNLFSATVVLPANVPVGEYRATTRLFSGNALLATSTDTLTVGKVGFEQAMTEFSRNHAFWYGLAAVLIAVFTGWLAGFIFRRD